MATSKSETAATEKAAETAHELIDQLTEKVAEAEARIRQAAEQTEGQLRRRADDVEQKSKALLEAVEDYVQERPVQALGIAFVGGLLLASWLRRR